MSKFEYMESELRSNLRSKSVQGGFFTLGGQALMFIIQIGGTAVLARLLSPGDFGLIAMVTALTGLPIMLKDAGLSMATVQKDRITHEQVSTLFWINGAISLGVSLLVCLSAPLVAWFYSDPRLANITLAIGASVFFGGLAIQHQALIRRSMRYATLAVILLLVQICATTIGILSALAGAGYWSLVAMHAANPVLLLVLSWFLSGWRPGLPKHGAGVREMLKFGGNLTIGRLVTYAVRRLDNVLIGYFAGATALGFYSKAYSLLMMPINQINGPIAAVAIPGLSRLQNEGRAYRNYYKKALFYMTSAGMPVVMLCFVLTEEIVLLVLGKQWLSAIPIFKALVPAAFIGTFNVAGSWALVPLGQAHRQMKLAVFGGIVTIAAFFIGINWGAMGVALALSGSVVLKRPITLWYAFKESKVNFSDFFRGVAVPSLASLIAAGVTLAVKCSLPEMTIHKEIPLYACIFLAVYLGIWFARPGAFKEVKALLSDFKIPSSRAKKANVDKGV